MTEIKQVPPEEFRRLYSFDFLDFFNYLDGHKSAQWQTIAGGEKLQKGDIVSFARIHSRARFGHIAVILEVLRQTSEKWVIRVCDSSNCLHEEDTRCKTMGIKSGIIHIYNPEAEVSIVKYSRLGKKYERSIRCTRLKELKKHRKGAFLFGRDYWKITLCSMHGAHRQLPTAILSSRFRW